MRNRYLQYKILLLELAYSISVLFYLVPNFRVSTILQIQWFDGWMVGWLNG